MSKSLQDQLIAAGLVDKKRAAAIDREARKQKRQSRKQGKRAPQEDEAARRAREARAEKAAHDRELERKRQEKAERKALAAQVRQLVLTHRVDRRDAEIAHRFVHGGKVKQIYVNASQHRELAQGKLLVVRSAGKYDLVPPVAADKIRERDASAVIDAAAAAQGEDRQDGYEGFEVPDDLMW